MLQPQAAAALTACASAAAAAATVNTPLHLHLGVCPQAIALPHAYGRSCWHGRNHSPVIRYAATGNYVTKSVSRPSPRAHNEHALVRQCLQVQRLIAADGVLSALDGQLQAQHQPDTCNVHRATQRCITSAHEA